MEFDVETDPDTLFELFGDDAASFAEYVVHISLSSLSLTYATATSSLGVLYGFMFSSVAGLSKCEYLGFLSFRS